MSNFNFPSYPLSPVRQAAPGVVDECNYPSSATLATAITRQASLQTFYTIRYLADRSLTADAYRAYAYFRWVDDRVDQAESPVVERVAFLARQREIIARCYQGDWPADLTAEEKMVADLIQAHPAENSGLGIYLKEMMAVMGFDAERQGRLISQAELDAYTRALATAVTEALHYFIGHDEAAPQDESRYLAVTGAHITHMLRDAVEDTAVGYYNIPREFLEKSAIAPTDIQHEAYRAWVQEQAQAAHRCFAAGRDYLARVENGRCRLAGYAYIGRFELVLDLIEKEGYRLRATYPERKSKRAVSKLLLNALSQTTASSLPKRQMKPNFPAWEASR